MPFLLRVELPDVPGSLGTLATTLGEAGADIEAIEIVEHRADGKAIDDVLLELASDVMPDALITACHTIEGVRVHWISRYNAGASLRMDLEAVEAFSAAPDKAMARFIDLVPATFRADWAMALEATDGGPAVIHRTPTAPELVAGVESWLEISRPSLVPAIDAWKSMLLAAAPIPNTTMVVVLGRHGGPEILASELARFGHMASLAGSVAG